MMNFTFITALFLSSLSWISVSVSESRTVEVQSGKDAILLCANMSSSESLTFWFRLVQRTKISCISVMVSSNSNAEFCEGIQEGKFEMRSNISTVSLKIKQVNQSDSGLYFCGFYTNGRPTFNVTHLNIKGLDEPRVEKENKYEKSDGLAKLTSVILGTLIVVLVMVIIGLIVKIRKFQTADKEEQKAEQSENESADELNYAAVTFRPAKGKRRELEQNVVYAPAK
ncbi:uncharacterized protein LOC121962267 [Plectropomus leopardus]|uniref:uncharacterized protein LOC121962267 n=1 Tax=Plectropomus leopardus TaxID=160734 RepID=UPI001C4AEBDF|nr:uncharacterized protein LOC121962267 [Plectropomus leopardus]